MIDITRALTSGHPNWPGDTPLTLELVADIQQGSAVNVMKLATSTHCGTHLDAPFHYSRSGRKLGSIALETLIGSAQVISATRGVTPELLEPLGHLPERVLFYTGEPAHWDVFPEFTPLTAELIHALADRGVKLVGTDAPSVDTLTSKDLPAHMACLERGVLILEGLNLHDVPEGSYELICLPLNLPGADASPVRASSLVKRDAFLTTTAGILPRRQFARAAHLRGASRNRATFETVATSSGQRLGRVVRSRRAPLPRTCQARRG